MAVSRGVKYLVGVLLSINFVAYWAVPVAGMGMIYKYALSALGRPLFALLDDAPLLRKFAAKYVYQKDQYNDFFFMSLVTAISIGAAFCTVLRWQIVHGSLPWWLIFSYYCAWVGLGGRAMGTAYTMAHKEGHNVQIYQKWWRRTIGNLFENRLGVLYGNVPFNFQTSHVHIHHKLDGGVGDTFYQWDLDRSSLSDFMLYVYRVLLHMTGVSSLRFFEKTGRRGMFEKLRAGCMQYFVYVPAALLLATKSASFVFFIYVQPLICMTFFLALLNFGFHGFLELAPDGTNITVVNSTCIINGDDDSFGEDDHYMHHYATTVYHRDLSEAHKARIAEFAQHKASVFEKLSILELSIFLLAGDFKKLAEHFVDYSGTMSKPEIAEMLQRRARCKEMSYDEYEAMLASGEVYKRHMLKSE